MKKKALILLAAALCPVLWVLLDPDWTGPGDERSRPQWGGVDRESARPQPAQVLFEAAQPNSRTPIEDPAPQNAVLASTTPGRPDLQPSTEDEIDRQIDAFMQSFLTADPDILGWTAFLGQLERLAELDSNSLEIDAHGVTSGEFAISGSDFRINFEINKTHYQLTLRGAGDAAGVDDLGYLSQVGWKRADNDTTQATGNVQFMPADGEQEHALDGSVVGYCFTTTDSQTLFRPMSAHVEGNRYMLTVPPETENRVAAYGDLRTVRAWASRLRRVEQTTTTNR